MWSASVGSLSRPSHGDSVGWSLEINGCRASLYPARVSTLPHGLSSRRRRKVGPAPWRIWSGSDCLDRPLAVSRAPLGPGDASPAALTWSEHYRAQCDAFDATL